MEPLGSVSNERLGLEQSIRVQQSKQPPAKPAAQPGPVDTQTPELVKAVSIATSAKAQKSGEVEKKQ